MPARAVNISLLVLVSLELASGLGSLLAGSPAGRWVLWTHGLVGFALLGLLGWKARIVVRSYRRRGLTVTTATAGVAALLFLAALLSGVLWATTGLPSRGVPGLGALTGLGFHIGFAVALVPLFVVHVVVYWPRVRRVDIASRRAALRALALAGGGLLAWRGAAAVTTLAGLSGAGRRFTGSREHGSFTGNGFPTTNWFTDRVQSIAPGDWQLRIHGAVARELTLSLDDLGAFERIDRAAVLDCTGGWYTAQMWSGLPLRTLLERAGLEAHARSVTVHSRSGYARRFPLSELDNLLLATQVGSEPLSEGHGYPARLVTRGRRGYDWVKWVTALEISSAPAWLQAPLPLQ